MPNSPFIGGQCASLVSHIKKRIFARERERPDITEEWRAFEKWQIKYDPARVICLDESSVKTNFTPLHAWSKKGKRCEGRAPGH